jgi:hypothetical protein
MKSLSMWETLPTEEYFDFQLGDTWSRRSNSYVHIIVSVWILNVDFSYSLTSKNPCLTFSIRYHNNGQIFQLISLMHIHFSSIELPTNTNLCRTHVRCYDSVVTDLVKIFERKSFFVRVYLDIQQFLVKHHCVTFDDKEDRKCLKYIRK